MCFLLSIWSNQFWILDASSTFDPEVFQFWAVCDTSSIKVTCKTGGKFYSQSIFSRFCLMMLNDFHVSSFSTFLLTEIRRSHHLVFSSSKQRICLESMGWPPGVVHVKGKVTKLSFGLQRRHKWYQPRINKPPVFFIKGGTPKTDDLLLKWEPPPIKQTVRGRH